MPSAAEIDVDECAVPNVSYSLSPRRGKPDGPPALAQLGHRLAPAGQDLVRVGLVADVPHDAVVRRVEDVVQRDRELDRAEVRRQVAAGLRDRLRAGTRAARARGRAVRCGRARAGRRACRCVRAADTWTLASMIAQHDPVGELDQPAALRRRKGASAACASRAQRLGVPLGFGEAQQRHVRRLVAARRPCRRSCRARRPAFDVEHVVDDLEREARRARVDVERGRFLARRAGARTRRPAAPPRGSARRSSSGASSAARASDSVLARRSRGRSPGRRPCRARRPRRASSRARARRTRASRSRRAARTPAPAARRRRAAPSLRRTRRGTWACRGAACRRPCTAGRRARANRRGSARPRRPARRRRPDRRRRTRRRRRPAAGACACRRPAPHSASPRAARAGARVGARQRAVEHVLDAALPLAATRPETRGQDASASPFRRERLQHALLQHLDLLLRVLERRLAIASSSSAPRLYAASDSLSGSWPPSIVATIASSSASAASKVWRRVGRGGHGHVDAWRQLPASKDALRS